MAFDPGLYISLNNANQLIQAIPETRRKSDRRVSKTDEEKIVRAFKNNRGYVNATAKDVGFSEVTVRKYLRKNNLEIKRGKKHLVSLHLQPN